MCNTCKLICYIHFLIYKTGAKKYILLRTKFYIQIYFYYILVHPCYY